MEWERSESEFAEGRHCDILFTLRLTHLLLSPGRSQLIQTEDRRSLIRGGETALRENLSADGLTAIYAALN